MQLQQESLPRIKTSIHAVQSALVFLAWVLTIAVYTCNGSSDSRTGWYFALCWLSAPILIYITLTPRWPRARRFGNVYAYAILDFLSIVLWLSAWAAVASYVSAGKAAVTDRTASGCDNFAYGSPSRCKLSEATTIIGVTIMLLFIGTAYLSFLAVMQYRKTGVMPSSDGNDFAVQSQEAFSSNMPHDEFEEEGGIDARQGGYMGGYQPQRQSMDDENTLLQGHEDMSQLHPAQPAGPLNLGRHSPNLGGYDTGYGGAYDRHSPNPVEGPDYGNPPPNYMR